MSPLAEALLDPLLDVGSRTWWGALLFSALALLGWWAWRRPAGWSLAALGRVLRHPSTRLDLQLYLGRQLLGLLLGGSGLAGAWWLATHAVRRMDLLLGVPGGSALSPWAISLAYSAALFVAWDFSRWAVHALLHRVPALWALHQVHHSAELLTPLTFHRVHPLESLLYGLRGTLVTAAVTALFFWRFREAAVDLRLLGVPAAGLALNLLFGNLRHSHVYLRFPAWLERWLISPAQHQLHHSADPAHFDLNYGTWLAVWDRLAGSFALSPETPPSAFGVPAAERNHGDDLLSAWFGPLRGLLPGRVALGAAGLLLLAGAARAQDDAPAEAPPEPSEDEGKKEGYDDAPGLSIVVIDEDGAPRVAGSAHLVSEESLERFEYDDIERILITQVPGITVRGEDGFGLRPNIGIRGANSDRSAKVTLLEDGVPLAPAPYAAPAAYYFPMSTRMVGVEVFKGPAATRHGPQTVAGAVNLLTRPVPWGQDYMLDLAGGLRLSGKAHGYWGMGGERFGVLIEGVHLTSDGFKELDNGGDTGFDRSEGMVKLRWMPNYNQVVELKLGYAHEVSHETYLGLSYSDWEQTPYRRYAASQNGLMRWNRTQAELSWAGQVAPGVQMRTVAYHHWLDRSWTKLNRFADGPDLHTLLQSDPTTGQGAVYMAILRGEEDSETADQALLIGTNHRTFHSYGVQTSWSWSVVGQRVAHTLEGGLRLHADDVWRVHDEDAYLMQGGVLVDAGEPAEVFLDAYTLARALALFAHDDMQIGRLHLLPGARLEVVNTGREDAGVAKSPNQTRLTPLPGLGALYGVNPSLDVFGGAYRGFSPVAPGQPEEVLPEISWNYEGGLRYAREEQLLELVGFFNDYKNLTGQCTISGGCVDEQLDTQFNGGAAWVYGAEAALRHVFLPAGAFTLPLDATYTFTRSRFRTAFVSSFPQFGSVSVGDSLPYLPEHQGSLRLSLQHRRGSLSLGGVVRSGMLDAAGTFPVSEQDIPPLFLLDAAAHVQVNPRVQLYATGSNLTNSTAITSWRPFGARPTAPLQVMVGVKVTPAPELY
ncbi:MAG: TonB-dependent receptor [Alphaproteobacteria bacterium]|nr:TonB-dependent receptor [Alphaproteobacteria bacterium]MCB9794695.1 TonB-dependent receptor [Alphaproteobacteria bacterium]